MAEEDGVYKLTTKEAIRLIKKAKNSCFAVHIAMNAYMVDNDEEFFPSALRTYLNVSKNDAIKLVSDCLSSTLEERGGRIRITIRRMDLLDKMIVTYWIG